MNAHAKKIVLRVLACLWLTCPAIVQAQTTVKYVHTDALGSVVAMTNASGAVVEATREYEPYGQQLTPALQNGPGYTGHVQDAATGLVYMQQRYYDPMLGIFYSVDPVTALSNPITFFHRYRYANSNPYRFTDPDGRASDDPKRQPRDMRSMASRPGLSTSNVKTVQVNPSGGSASGQSSSQGRSSGNSVSNYLSGVKDSTTFVASGTAAGGIGGAVEYSNQLTTGEQKVDVNAALGVGVGAFAGLEIDVATFSVPSFAQTPIFMDSGEIKVGSFVAGGLKLHFDVGGQMTLKAFGGVGLGGSGIINKPLSLGATVWESED